MGISAELSASVVCSAVTPVLVAGDARDENNDLDALGLPVLKPGEYAQPAKTSRNDELKMGIKNLFMMILLINIFIYFKYNVLQI